MTETIEKTAAEKHWYVVYTKSRSEKKVDTQLTLKGIESYCPTKKIEKQWSDRKKIIDEVIFRSYVFVRITEAEQLRVKETEGVVNFIHYERKPAVIRDEEIEIIRKFLNEKDAAVSLIPSSEFMPDTKVKINHGVFMDNRGTILRTNKKKVYVQLEGLAQVMVIEFPIEHLTPIDY